MVNITLSINEEIKKKMENFPEINWSQVSRAAIEKKLSELKFLQEFTKHSEITMEDAEVLGNEVGRMLAKKYGILE